MPDLASKAPCWIAIGICLLTGCAGSSRLKLYSPQAHNGTPVWQGWVHGGPTSGSPPDHWLVGSLDDSLPRVLVSSENISFRLAFVGILFPLVPLPVPYKEAGSRYSGMRNETVKIRIASDSEFPLEKVDGLIRIKEGGTPHSCQKVLMVGSRGTYSHLRWETYGSQKRRSMVSVPKRNELVCETGLLKSDVDSFMVLLFRSAHNTTGEARADTIRFHKDIQKILSIGP